MLRHKDKAPRHPEEPPLAAGLQLELQTRGFPENWMLSPQAPGSSPVPSWGPPGADRRGPQGGAQAERMCWEERDSQESEPHSLSGAFPCLPPAMLRTWVSYLFIPCSSHTTDIQEMPAE